MFGFRNAEWPRGTFGQVRDGQSFGDGTRWKSDSKGDEMLEKRRTLPQETARERDEEKCSRTLNENRNPTFTHGNTLAAHSVGTNASCASD